MRWVLLGILLAAVVSAVAEGEEYGAPVIADAAPEETPTATPAPTLANPKCTKIMTIDGPGDFLWKAQSESNGKLAIIFPDEFIVPFNRVFVNRVWNYRNGKLVYRKRPVMEQCKIGAYGNGNRLHVWCPYPGAYYDGHVYAEGAQTGELCEWQVPCPSQRQD